MRPDLPKVSGLDYEPTPHREERGFSWSTCISATSLIIMSLFATWQVYEYFQDSKRSNTLSYARDLFVGSIGDDTIYSFYDFKSKFSSENDQMPEASENDQMPEAHVLILFDYYAQVVQCVDKGLCDRELFCDFMGADFDTLLGTHHDSIKNIVDKIYPIVNRYDNIEILFARQCTDKWKLVGKNMTNR